MICGKCKNYLSTMDLGVDWTAGKCTKRKIKVGSRTDATDCMDFDIKDYYKEPKVNQMEDEEFEKYWSRIEELYKIGKLCENPTISIHIVHSKIRKQKLKEILEEIVENNQTTWTIHYPKNMKRG